MVDEATIASKNAKRNGLLSDLFCVVYDRESKTKYPDKLHAKAYDKANQNNIVIVHSNICFEYWLLLHFEYSRGCYCNCDDLISNSNLKKSLKALNVTDYNKGNKSLFNVLSSNLDFARENAKKAYKELKNELDSGKKPYEINPYTNFHELLDKIDSFVKTI